MTDDPLKLTCPTPQITAAVHHPYHHLSVQHDTRTKFKQDGVNTCILGDLDFVSLGNMLAAVGQEISEVRAEP